MNQRVPWLPSHLPAGANPERCPHCGRRAFIPWTLRRDIATKTVMRRWICTECQRDQERAEPE
jgi:DNA-directed RNA polymerase subunit RPC12/RpoP